MKLVMKSATRLIIRTLLSSSVTAAGGLVDVGKTVIFELENNYEVPTTSVSIHKVWDDMENLDGSRPASLDVTLLRDGAGYRIVTLSEANNWSAEIDGLLLLHSDGTVIDWTWSETAPEGYVLTSQRRLGNTTVLQNTHNPQLTSTTVTKIWEDSDNAANLRPATLRVTLSGGGTYYLSEANNWTVTVENLPKYVNGVEQKYTWSEQTVAGYSSDVRINGNTTVFINHYSVVMPPPPPGNPPRTPVLIIEDYGTPLGVQVMINHVGDCFD